MEETAHYTHPLRKVVLRAVLGFFLCVNLAMSLYQLPLNRLVERRLCVEHYAIADPSVIQPDGTVGEQLCKVDAVQKRLGSIQGIMESLWIAGGKLY